MVPRVVVLVATAMLQSPGVVAQAADNRAHARTTLSAIAAGEFGKRVGATIRSHPRSSRNGKPALAARRDVTFRSYPTQNHLFIAGSGPSVPAEYKVPGHVAEEVIIDIVNWIQMQPQ